MTIAIIVLLAIIFLCLFVKNATREDRLISKYLLRDFEKPKIKATLTATPTETLTVDEWKDFIFVERNSPLSDTN